MPRRVLDPIDRTSEILFGVIMALTFTRSIRVAHALIVDLLPSTLSSALTADDVETLRQRVNQQALPATAVTLRRAILGTLLGRYAGRPGWRTGLGMVAVGLVLVAVTLALGG